LKCVPGYLRTTTRARLGGGRTARSVHRETGQADRRHRSAITSKVYVRLRGDGFEGQQTSDFVTLSPPAMTRVRRSGRCLLMAQSRHAQCADDCPLLGTKQTVTNRCGPISICRSEHHPIIRPNVLDSAVSRIYRLEVRLLRMLTGQDGIEKLPN
jgi:hypothetical protein